MRFLRRNAIALTALVFAMTGTGIAASHYLITSTSQIKPSVLQQIRGEAVASAAKAGAAKKGVHGLRLKAHVSEAITLSQRHSRRLAKGGRLDSELSTLPLTESTWTQYPEELNEVVGVITYERPTGEECPEGGTGILEVFIDGQNLAAVEIGPANTSAPLRETTSFDWEGNGETNGTDWWLFPGTEQVSHTIAVQGYVFGQCDPSRFKVDSLNLSVLGAR